MGRQAERVPDSAEKTIRDIRRATRRRHSAEDKIRIVLEGLPGKVSITELCRKKGINRPTTAITIRITRTSGIIMMSSLPGLTPQVGFTRLVSLNSAEFGQV